MKNKSTEHYWENFVNALLVPILVLDDNGIILYANSAALHLFKKKQQDMTGTYFSFPFKEKKTREIEIFIPPNQIIFTDIIIKKGQWVNVDAWIVTLHDITERKKTKSNFKFLKKCLKMPKKGSLSQIKIKISQM